MLRHADSQPSNQTATSVNHVFSIVCCLLDQLNRQRHRFPVPLAYFLLQDLELYSTWLALFICPPHEIVLSRTTRLSR